MEGYSNLLLWSLRKLDLLNRFYLCTNIRKSQQLHLHCNSFLLHHSLSASKLQGPLQREFLGHLFWNFHALSLSSLYYHLSIFETIKPDLDLERSFNPMEAYLRRNSQSEWMDRSHLIILHFYLCSHHFFKNAILQPYFLILLCRKLYQGAWSQSFPKDWLHSY